jgi:hypothetical protein
MNTFRVWIRPLGTVCRVRVEGVGNTEWLLDRLSESFVFKTSEPLTDVNGTSQRTFRVAYRPQMSRRTFEKLLAAIPEVSLMTDPA